MQSVDGYREGIRFEKLNFDSISFSLVTYLNLFWVKQEEKITRTNLVKVLVTNDRVVNCMLIILLMSYERCMLDVAS